MIDPFVLDILLEIVKAIVGVAIPAMTVWLMFHTKRINDNVKKNALQSKIDQLSQHSEQLQSFQGMTLEDRIEALMEGARRHAMDNDVSISEIELRMMVESSLSSLRTLNSIVLRLKLMKENKNGKTIEK